MIKEFVRKGGNKKYTFKNGKRVKGTRGGTRVGVFVALRGENGNIRTGWSLCHNKLDKFDSRLGIKIAMGRAKNGSSVVPVADSIKCKYDKFVERAKKYYKMDNVEVAE